MPTRQDFPKRAKDGSRARVSIDPADRRVVTLLALAAVVSIVILVVDHFNRVSDAMIVLSSFLLLGVVALLLGLGLLTHRARIHAAEAEAIRSASVEASRYGVITTDREGVILAWNRSASEIFGYDRVDVLGRESIALIIPEDQQEDYRMNLRDIADGSSNLGLGEYLEVSMKDSLGRVFPVELSVARIPTDPPMLTMFARSLTQKRIREEENRRLADIVRSLEDAVISVDLNGRITAWNRGAENIYGYTGPEALTKRLTDLTHAIEGGQELGSLFRRVLTGISGEINEERMTLNGETLWVTSQGFPIRDLGGEVAGMSLISRDVTEQHKRDIDEEREVDRHHWHEVVANALTGSDLVLWAQPVYDLQSGEISHSELLIRLMRGDEVVPPGTFLPHVEDTDLMARIDRWVIEKGTDIARNMPVAINLSGTNVSDVTLGRWIAQAIEESGADPTNLRFEITESAAIENLQAARKLAAELTGIGCRLSLDDFGTGYGSFTYLKYLPVHEIKIDASFIQDLTTDEANQRVVKSLIAIARTFSVSTVAEGIEDQATENVVRELGVNLGQGFHLGRPAPVRRF